LIQNLPRNKQAPYHRSTKKRASSGIWWTRIWFQIPTTNFLTEWWCNLIVGLHQQTRQKPKDATKTNVWQYTCIVVIIVLDDQWFKRLSNSSRNRTPTLTRIWIMNNYYLIFSNSWLQIIDLNRGLRPEWLSRFGMLMHCGNKIARHGVSDRGTQYAVETQEHARNRYRMMICFASAASLN